MPKATAVWLVENTALTFDQIADFCGLHPLEVQAIADDEVAVGMQGMDPIVNGELTGEEIERCSGDPSARLEAAKPSIPMPKDRPKGARYTPVSKRQDRPDAIAWLLKNYPELSDGQVSKLIGTTKPTINAVRDRTHWNAPQIKPRNPVGLGLCSSADLEKVVAIARARAGTVRAPKPAKEPAAAETAEPAAKAPAAETAEPAEPDAPAVEPAEPTAETAEPAAEAEPPAAETPPVEPAEPTAEPGKVEPAPPSPSAPDAPPAPETSPQGRTD
jgi:hypothetical protein